MIGDTLQEPDVSVVTVSLSGRERYRIPPLDECVSPVNVGFTEADKVLWFPQDLQLGLAGMFSPGRNNSCCFGQLSDNRLELALRAFAAPHA